MTDTDRSQPELEMNPKTQSFTGDFLVAVKQDCPTCQLIVPVLEEMAEAGKSFSVLCQDDLDFLQSLEGNSAVELEHDQDLRRSHHLGVEIVPTLFRRTADGTLERNIGWNQAEWRLSTGLAQLGSDLPASRPGCGALNLEPKHLDRLQLEETEFAARTLEIGEEEDPFEAAFARGWTDGLPVVPPTPERVARMLRGTECDPRKVVGTVAPDLVPCTVEKVAINAVMAGCLPEYMPVVIAAMEAACDPVFNWHGLAATTFFSGPVIVVNGPIVQRLGFNSGINALGQGTRANMTVGRALNLTLRNVGGAVPGGVDRAALGNPGKLSFCIAENEVDSPWNSLAASRGIDAGKSAVTLFAGEGPRGIVDQLSREPESLTTSLAMALESIAHPKLAMAFDALLVVAPEHARVFKRAGWNRERVLEELHKRLRRPGSDLVRGAHGCAEGLPEQFRSAEAIPKFQPNGILLIHAGGNAGLFSSVIPGWVNGEIGSSPVTRVVDA